MTPNELQNEASIFPPTSMPEIEDGMDAFFNPNVVSSREDKTAPTTWSVQYRVFDVEIPEQRQELETIMSGCMNGKHMLCFEETSWDKIGRLRVVLKWATLPE